MAIQIARLLRFTTERSHADDFLAGRVRFRFSKSFQDETPGVDGRRDELECRRLYAPSSLSSLTVGSHVIPASDLAGDVEIAEHAMLLCLSAVRDDELSSERVSALMSNFCKLGPYCVAILNPREFLRRLASAVERAGYEVEPNLVRYREQATGRPLFTKHSAFSWQREFRVALHGAEPEDQEKGHMFVDTGSLADICAVLEAR